MLTCSFSAMPSCDVWHGAATGFKFKELTFMMLLERLLVMASLGLSGNLPAKPLTAMSQLWALALVCCLFVSDAMTRVYG